MEQNVLYIFWYVVFWLQILINGIQINIINALMFTFKEQKLISNKIAPLPEIQQPQRLFPLPPLPFTHAISQPLSIAEYNKFKNEKQAQKQQQLAHKYLMEKSQLEDQYNQLKEQYFQLERQYEILKNQYRQGEHIFKQMEAEYIRTKQQIQALRNKKQEKSKINIGLKKKEKQIPVVKISVPNPKSLAEESQKDSIYRQLKSASEELNHMRKMLESEKQKSQQMQNYLTKNIEQISLERDNLKRQIVALKEQNKNIKDQSNKLKSANSNGQSSVRSKNTENMSQNQKLKSDLQRLQLIHKSCEILISSKDNEINSLKLQVERLHDAKNKNDYDNNLMRTQSRKIVNSFIYERERSPKEALETNILFPESEMKKHPNTDKPEQHYSQILEQHFNLSPKQMKSIQEFVKAIVSQFMNKIEEMKNQLAWSYKKSDHLQFQLQKVYQLLKDKKYEVDNFYKDLKNVSRNTKSTPIKQIDTIDREDDYLKSILKGKRDFSA